MIPPDIHPLSEKYPLMDAEEFAAFKADLAAHGLKNPIWLFGGQVLDGRNRLRACLELGIDPAFAEFEGSEAEAVAFVDSQNLHRRHLSRAWRQQRVREMRELGLSTWVIAQQVGCSQATVWRDLASDANPTPPDPRATNRESVDSHESTDSPTADTTDGDLPRPTVLPEPDPSSVESHDSTETVVREPETQQDVKPNPMPPPEQPRVQGRDGRSYRAQRPAAPKPKPTPREKAQWAELAAVLSELAEKVETLVPTPEESERPWELISSLEATAASLLRQAQRLRRRHHL
jgi:ParB-like chromosome segregation protein Spo0J